MPAYSLAAATAITDSAVKFRGSISESVMLKSKWTLRNPARLAAAKLSVRPVRGKTFAKAP
jgi:hypothetical protein